MKKLKLQNRTKNVSRKRIIEYPQEYEGGITILDNLIENEKKDPRVSIVQTFQTQYFTIFIICQDYHELPKRTIMANGNISHILKPKIFRDFQKLYQNKDSIDRTPNEFKLLLPLVQMKKKSTSHHWYDKRKNTGSHRSGLNSTFVQDANSFILNDWVFIQKWLMKTWVIQLIYQKEAKINEHLKIRKRFWNKLMIKKIAEIFKTITEKLNERINNEAEIAEKKEEDEKSREWNPVEVDSKNSEIECEDSVSNVISLESRSNFAKLMEETSGTIMKSNNSLRPRCFRTSKYSQNSFSNIGWRQIGNRL